MFVNGKGCFVDRSNQERQGISRKLIMKGKDLLRPMIQVITPDEGSGTSNMINFMAQLFVCWSFLQSIFFGSLILRNY